MIVNKMCDSTETGPEARLGAVGAGARDLKKKRERPGAEPAPPEPFHRCAPDGISFGAKQCFWLERTGFPRDALRHGGLEEKPGFGELRMGEDRFTHREPAVNPRRESRLASPRDERRGVELGLLGDTKGVPGIHRRLSKAVLEAPMEAQVQQVVFPIQSRQSHSFRARKTHRTVENRTHLETKKRRLRREFPVQLDEHSALAPSEARGVVGLIDGRVAQRVERLRPSGPIRSAHQDIDVGHGSQARVRVERSGERGALEKAGFEPLPFGDGANLVHVVKVHGRSRELQVGRVLEALENADRHSPGRTALKEWPGRERRKPVPVGGPQEALPIEKPIGRQLGVEKRLGSSTNEPLQEGRFAHPESGPRARSQHERTPLSESTAFGRGTRAR